MTAWFGKWHLTSHDNRWTPARNAHALEPYGFDGGTYPSPDGAPGEGSASDPRSPPVRLLVTPGAGDAALVHDGLAREPARHRLVVSLERPHRYRALGAHRRPHACRRISRLPPSSIARHKPRLQISLQQTAASGFGAVPYTGPNVKSVWLPLPGPLSQALARGGRARSERSSPRSTAARRSPPTRSSCSPPIMASTARRTACAARAAASTRKRQGSADRQRPPRQSADARAERSREPA